MGERNVKNKPKGNIRKMWNAFWQPEAEEMSEAEEIMQDASLSSEMKKLLINALKQADHIVLPTDREVIMRTDLLGRNQKEMAQKTLEKNPIQLNTPFKIEKETGKIVRNSHKKDIER